MYFQVHTRPIGNASSDAVVVDHFHPRWREAVSKLMKTKGIVSHMKGYANKTSEWAGVPIRVEFDDDLGLTRISISDRGSLELSLEPREAESKYRSHNLNSFVHAGAAALVISEYVNWLGNTLKLSEK